MYLQFCIPCVQQDVEAWSDLLIESGAAAVSVEDAVQQAIFEIAPEHKPVWDQVNLLALFTEDFDPLLVQLDLAQHLPATTIANGTWTSIADENWVTKSQQFLQPMQFGDKIWVCPSWCAIPDPSALNIILDPEMAFGSGSHATTALCLRWLAQHLTPNASVIDFGCGSGILGIAAAKLGASRIYAIDIDPLALEISLNNAQKNNVNMQQFISLLPSEVAAANIQADVVVANILAHTLTELAPVIAALVKPNGKLIMSGILAEQAADLKLVYAQWFTNFAVQQQEDWVLISAELTS